MCVKSLETMGWRKEGPSDGNLEGWSADLGMRLESERKKTVKKHPQKDGRDNASPAQAGKYSSLVERFP